MKNTFMVTVYNKVTHEVTVHKGCTSVMSNLGGLLISTADLEQFQYDSNNVAAITDVQ